ncbi:MAG: DDE-type integrase/transposase/recombinase [Paracoccaceae bacterium]|nr:DDE-type integrase/transposase/recombinase [Paracoccaceae bacterium]
MIACRAGDETSISVGGEWRHLERAIYAKGQLVDFRLTVRRDTKATNAFLNKDIKLARLHGPISFCTAFRDIGKASDRSGLQKRHCKAWRLSDWPARH